MRSLFIFTVVLLFSQSLNAQTRYVSDEFEIMVRTGPSSKNKILKVLKSGARVEVVQADAGNDHSQIRTSDGETGYALTRYLSPNPSARNRVVQLEKQLEQMRSKPDELRSLLAKAQEDNEQLIAKNTQLTDQLDTVSKELEKIKLVSADAVNMAAKNTKLEQEVQQYLLQIDDIRIKNQALKDQSQQRWFMIGSGVALLFLFLGWVLSIAKRPRRQSWGM